MGAGRHLKQCLIAAAWWIAGAAILCGCTPQPQTPPTVELNGSGTFEALVREHTYTGTFTVEGIACTVQLNFTDAAPVSWCFNGEQYTISSGGKSIDCTASAFPADSLWRILPEVLSQIWADNTFYQPTENGWCRTIDTQGGTAELAVTGEENVVILRLPNEMGTAALYYSGN